MPGLAAYVRLNAGAELRARESTLDIVQSACREVLERLPKFRIYRDEVDFKRWLYRTVQRKIVARARKAVLPMRSLTEKEAEVVLDGCSGFFSPSRQAAAREELTRVEEAFRQLPDDYREVIVQAHILGRSRSEIAADSGRSPGAVRALLCRAVARLAVRAGFMRP
ncbi:MAG: sigma-70 family RNA polymerase sigma factor [bacterium]|nr:sigma-70 family RNA polymerase sigma factor [bacterium]